MLLWRELQGERSPSQHASMHTSRTTLPNMASATWRAQVEVLECEWGCGADEARLEQVLKADTDKKIKAVAVVHNETTTGVTSDVGGVRQVRLAAACARLPVSQHIHRRLLQLVVSHHNSTALVYNACMC